LIYFIELILKEIFFVAIREFRIKLILLDESIGVKLKKKFDYIYENYGHIIIWVVLAIQAIVVAVVNY